MILKDGTSVKSIWYYSQNNIDYEVDDIIIAEFNQRRYIGIVTRAFNSTNIPAENAFISYCKCPAGYGDFVTTATLMSKLNSLARYFSIYSGIDGGLSTLENADVSTLRKPGLYKVYQSTTGLPVSLSQTSHSWRNIYLRVSTTVENPDSVMFEILCFELGRYFVGVGSYGDPVSWKEFTPGNIGTATGLIETALQRLNAENQQAAAIVSAWTSRVKYRYNNQSSMETTEEGNRTLNLFCDSQAGYLINCSAPDTYNMNNGQEGHFTKKYSFRIDPTDPVGTVYDKYGTTLSTKVTQFKILRFSVNQLTNYTIKGWQEGSLEDAQWGRLLNSAGQTIEVFGGAPGIHTEPLNSGEATTIELTVPTVTTTSFGVWDADNNPLQPILVVDGILKKLGAAALMLALPSEVTITSIYEVS